MTTKRTYTVAQGGELAFRNALAKHERLAIFHNDYDKLMGFRGKMSQYLPYDRWQMVAGRMSKPEKELGRARFLHHDLVRATLFHNQHAPENNNVTGVLYLWVPYGMEQFRTEVAPFQAPEVEVIMVEPNTWRHHHNAVNWRNPEEDAVLRVAAFLGAGGIYTDKDIYQGAGIPQQQLKACIKHLRHLYAMEPATNAACRVFLRYRPDDGEARQRVFDAIRKMEASASGYLVFDLSKINPNWRQLVRDMHNDGYLNATWDHGIKYTRINEGEPNLHQVWKERRNALLDLERFEQFLEQVKRGLA